jgi:hypothetical protein
MPAQRCCKLCLETFEIERKRGRPREYCPDCSPAGYQVVWLRGRHKLRARPPSFRRFGYWQGFPLLEADVSTDVVRLASKGGTRLALSSDAHPVR